MIAGALRFDVRIVRASRESAWRAIHRRNNSETTSTPLSRARSGARKRRFGAKKSSWYGVSRIFGASIRGDAASAECVRRGAGYTGGTAARRPRRGTTRYRAAYDARAAGMPVATLRGWPCAQHHRAHPARVGPHRTTSADDGADYVPSNSFLRK
ncbi:TPA: hypothetical protein QDB03_001361 [Burkholderia vietnamiensis]|uniref:hypothetical protein n=1 Tax=Burkholderia vietnamiensis TaxID=60552 RepID=UPI0012DAD80B|nr:hypothetical protein [Burkholderia vietnamiensis]MCA8071153.1 hypothetical protein [Burkholderia vietnamiensis]UEC03800.1 hypothetical protein LK462_31400 [Burkholderia vietnamiensis]HDR8987779.1 hypothetical protein [Burkholderia vietnamiensis]HDR9059766.1 hypothetical protein [Burkholderia vietnamiensis]